jgi:hypothetical protein
LWSILKFYHTFLLLTSLFTKKLDMSTNFLDSPRTCMVYSNFEMSRKTNLSMSMRRWKLTRNISTYPNWLYIIEPDVVLLKPQSHCHVSTATCCYVLKCYVSCHFLMVCTFHYVYTTLFYVFLRTVTFCHGLLEMQSLRFATYVLRFTTLRYLLVRFSTFQLRSITFEVRFDTF